jgi:lysyl-tRNA synthetase class 2
LLLAVVIAPGMRGYQFVYDYPLSQAALARVSASDASVAERFELFYDGVELANGFSELTDAAQQRARFEADNRARAQKGLPQHAIDELLLAALGHGLEECAGVALGLDRLLMVLLDLDSIDQVLTFRA